MYFHWVYIVVHTPLLAREQPIIVNQEWKCIRIRNILRGRIVIIINIEALIANHHNVLSMICRK